MYKDKLICAVIPAHNESTQIHRVIDTMPDYVDKLVIVDDESSDDTVEKVKKYQETNKKIVLLSHEVNQGVGGAIATGYKWARDNNYDIAVVMAGDGQMDPKDLPNLLDPVVEDKADYSKGNRLFTGEAYKKIPKIRYFGNAFLSLFTKIASGYWQIADSQSGYTAINKKALETINWDKMYKRYGQPNDLLVRLNVYNFRVKDVPIEPVYNIGEKSGIKIRIVMFTISWLLIKMFLFRMKEKYIIRNFHPLIFFYFFGALFGGITILLTFRMFYYWLFIGYIPSINALAAMFSFMSSSMFALFGMWFDMEVNKDLSK
ncbi:MAG: glycosyltransferase family 2 protein [Desulfobacterales bacterium]|nr:glycosyltransferase family 2 protein [Desulfobacterales bacterium]